MISFITQNIVSITFITALAYALQNSLEKYMFNSLDLSINKYNFIRNIFIVIIFSTIYIYFNTYLIEPSNSNKKKQSIVYNKTYYIIIFFLILLATVFNIVFTYLRIFGIMTYDIGLFNIMLNILSIILNVIFGIILFNEEITNRNIIGIILGIASVYFLN